MKSVMNDNKYIDVHAWCFVPHSFRLMLHDLFCLQLTAFREADFHTTNDCEFYVTISRNDKDPDIPRYTLLETIATELNETLPPPKILRDRLKNIIKHIIRRNR